MAGSTGGSRASARTRKRSQKATPSESDHQPSATAAQASSSSVPPPPPAATTSTTAASTSSARKPRTTTTKRGARVATKNANAGGGGNLTDASSAKASSVDLAGYDDLLYSSRGGGGGEDVKPDLQQHYASGSEPPIVDVNAPGYLAPDYTLNPAGPASSADIDFKCPKCDKTYRGKHARSIWRRHLQDKHGIPLAAQPRRTRWDNDANRPKSEEEKRTRTLESKRRWARKNRAEKGSVTGSARKTRDDTRPPTPSVAGSVGTPATDDEDDDFERPGDLYAGAGDGRGFVSANLLPLPLPLPPPPNGGFIDDEEGDSSFDAGSVGGWSAEGPPGLARGGSAPLGYPPPSSSSSHAHYPPPPPPLMQHPHHHGHSSSYASAPSPSNPFYPQPSLYGYPVGRRTPTRSAANGHGHGEGGGGGGGVGGGIGGDSYLVAIAAAAATTRGAGPSAAASSSSSSTALPPLPAATADGGGGSDVRRSSRRRVSTARRRDGGGALADEDDDDAEGHELPPLPQLSYHHHQASSSSSGGGGGNPYSQPFHPHATAQDQPHGPPLASTFAHHHHSHPHQYYHDNGANARPLSPMLLSAAGAASSASSGGYAPPRPHSNPNPVFPSPYDMPRALPVPPVSPGAPAPVAMPYYARRQSPARVVTTTSGIAGGMGMGMGGGIPAPTSGSNAHREAVNAQGGLESPVKLRRTGLNGKGKEAIHRAGGASTTTSNGGQGGGGAGNDAGGAVRGPHREDAAGILLALKAGPSSPMAPHVQSPVSSIRGSGPPSMSMMGAPMGRGRRTPLRRRKGKGVHEGGDGDEDDHDHEEEEEDDDDEDDGAVQSLMLRSRAGQQASTSNGPLSPWRTAMHAGSAASTSSSTSHLPPNMTPTAAAEALSPRKRGRSTSPVPMLASTSSSGEGGSTAAAHALLATAKKAHHQYAVAGGAGGGSETGPSWRTEASLVATPTPGNMMRMIESSPVVRFEQRGSAHLGGSRRHHHDDDEDDEDDDAAVGELTSEGDMMRPPTEADDDDNGGADRQRGGESFSSSSGGGRRSRGRASLENERRRRGGAAGAGGGSSSSGTGAGSSSAARPLHHHHPAGLTSELGEFDIQPSSSSSGGRTQQHHHHDPLRELDAMLPGSSSSGGGTSQAHLVTPAPAGSAALRRTVSDNGPPPPRQVATHPHDPFVAAGVMAEGILPLSGAALSNLARQTEPQSFVFSSPRHPVFSEKLGLTATPGPGVLYTRAGGETPARGSHAANGADDASSAGGRIRELSGSNTSGDDDAKALRTPVMGRLFATSLQGGGDGRRAGGPAPPTSSVGMPASDIDSMGGEDESETTGTAGTGRESQSPGKATVDDDYEDDDGYSEA